MQLNIISNFLANYHNWPIEDVTKEFDTYLDANEIPLSAENSRFLLKCFIEIEPTERFNTKFDHFKFVYKAISNLKDQNIF